MTGVVLGDEEHGQPALRVEEGPAAAAFGQRGLDPGRDGLLDGVHGLLVFRALDAAQVAQAAQAVVAPFHAGQDQAVRSSDEHT